MLEEILALVLSLFSLVTNETPRVSLRETDNTQGGFSSLCTSYLSSQRRM